jgi:hypothetical protein
MRAPHLIALGRTNIGVFPNYNGLMKDKILCSYRFCLTEQKIDQALMVLPTVSNDFRKVINGRSKARCVLALET